MTNTITSETTKPKRTKRKGTYEYQLIPEGEAARGTSRAGGGRRAPLWRRARLPGRVLESNSSPVAWNRLNRSRRSGREKQALIKLGNQSMIGRAWIKLGNQSVIGETWIKPRKRSLIGPD
jgi:hypothetical protein